MVEASSYREGRLTDSRVSTVERAFQLARGGACRSIADIGAS